MKLMIPCNECTQIAFESNDVSELIQLSLPNVELNDDGYYEVTCDNGHDFIVIVQQMKFEILFDFGVMALNDGYSRESVSNFASSFERFFEFCIEVFLYNNGLTSKDFEDIWKNVKNQSERQLGAYYFLFLSTLKEQPASIQRKWIEFRNRVVHQGYIPKSNEAMEYGEYIFNYINDVLDKLQENCKVSMDTVVINNLRRLNDKAGVKNLSRATMCIPTIISISVKDRKRDFNLAVKEMRKNRLFQYTNIDKSTTFIKDIDNELGKTK